MKKLFTILLIMVLFVFTTNDIYAQDEHIILDDNYLSESSFTELNNDLNRIETNYGISIYFVLDQSINDTGKYAKDFLNSHSDSKNIVVLVVSSNDYSLAASGNSANDVLSARNSIWDKYNNASTYTDGIRDYYQEVVRIVNESNYSSAAPSVSGTPSVYDEAGLLTSEQYASLSNKINQLREKHGMDIVVVTTNDLNGLDAVDYADDFYDYNGYAKDGVLMLISMSDRGWHVSTKGKGITYFTDYGIDLIVEKMMNNLSNGDFYGAFNIFADQADYYIEQGKQGSIIDINNNREPEKPKSFGVINGVIATVVGALSSLFSALILKGQMKSIRMEKYAGSYVVDDSFVLTGSSDMLVDTHVTRSYNPPSRSSSGSSSGGSSVHTSSSGSSHGGHGGHF